MDAVQKLLDSLTDIDSSLSCLCKAVKFVDNDQRRFGYHFDSRQQFKELVPKTDSETDESLAEAFMITQQFVAQIIECTTAVWSACETANVAANELPQEVVSNLDGLSGKPWIATLRHELLDTVVVWPGETPAYATRGSRKLTPDVHVFLQYLANRDPLPEWQEFRATSRSLSRLLVAVRDIDKSDIAGSDERGKSLLSGGRDTSPRSSSGLSADDVKTFVLSMLVKHHKWDSTSGDLETIGCWDCLQLKDLAEKCGVKPPRASEAMKKLFGGYKAYQILCRNKRLPVQFLKLRDEESRAGGFDKIEDACDIVGGVVGT